MVTIKDIAKNCDVSITTVSNILNNKGNISDGTRKRVLEVAKKMNYVPNYMAKNLKQKSTKIIGVITEDLTVFNCPEIVDGINQYLEEEGYTFLLGNLRLYKKYDSRFYSHDDYFSQVEEEFNIMFAKNVVGIIYIASHCRNIEAIPKNLPIPIVVAYGYSDSPKLPSVIFDDEQAAYDLTMHLIRKGYTRIGVISGEDHSMHSEKRLLGYQRALFENSILYDPSIVQSGDWQRDKAYEAGKLLVERGIKVIFSMNDMMAAGVYDYLYDRGLVVGKDVEIVGFDNHEVSRALKPALTTMALPLHQIGESSAKLLIDKLEGVEMSEENEILKIKCNLIIRETV